MRLSPLDPQRWIFFGGLSLAHLVAAHHEEVVEWADRALRENPRMTAVVNFKVAACGYLARFEEGRECMRRLNELLPGRVVANVRRSYETFVSPEVRAILEEGRRRVGLPQE